VPAYNKAAYVHKTLENLTNLASHGYKAIVVDDASTDGTRDIIKNYAQQHTEINAYFMYKNSKKVGAQKVALRNLPSGIETVIMLDADSCIRNPEDIPKAVSKLYKNDNLAGGVFTISPEGKGFWKHLQDAEYAMAEGMKRWTSGIGKVKCASGAGAIYKRGLLQNALDKHSGEFLGDDFELTTILQDQGYKMAVFPEVNVGTYVPTSWAGKVKQHERWLRGGWRVWRSKKNELSRQLLQPNRFAVALAMELAAPLTLLSTMYGTVEAAKRFDFPVAYMTTASGWAAVNTTLAAYGRAAKKNIAKTALFSYGWIPLVLTVYLPAFIAAAGNVAKERIRKIQHKKK
jgi:cellulose synthase/poly-beta-1,6-N-acetylglucosamine synthase-like glycosyltransferase